MIGMEPSAVYRDLQTLFAAGAVGGLTDRELLEQFTARRDARAAETAFAALLRRHGPMVWGVCRRILNDPHDAADAFQATFLILVRRAGTVRVDDSLGRWLYGVSRRVAARARTAAARRSAREVPGVEAVEAPARDPVLDEVLAGIDEEIGKLPERCRAALILCDLGGLSHEDAARQLGCAVGTVGSLVSRGRERLRSRLVARGLTPAAGMLALALAAETNAATLPVDLVQSTARAAVQYSAGPAALAGAVPASVITLAEGVWKSMVIAKLKVAAFAMLTACVVTGTAVVPALSTSAAAPPEDARKEGLAEPQNDKPDAKLSKQSPDEALQRLQDEVDALAAHLEIKKRELEKAKVQVDLNLAIVATNIRLNARRPGMVSQEELRKNEADVAIAKAHVGVVEAEVRAAELRLRQAERWRDNPGRGKGSSRPGGSAIDPYPGLERRLGAIERKLDLVLEELNSTALGRPCFDTSAE